MLKKIPLLCKKFHAPNLFILDESRNPTGTHKDRRSRAIVTWAKKRNIKTLTIVTAGNGGIV